MLDYACSYGDISARLWELLQWRGLCCVRKWLLPCFVFVITFEKCSSNHVIHILWTKLWQLNVYFDISDDFNIVSHEIFLHKFNHNEFSPCHWEWFRTS
jgi:hypothetical protein